MNKIEKLEQDIRNLELKRERNVDRYILPVESRIFKLKDKLNKLKNK